MTSEELENVQQSTTAIMQLVAKKLISLDQDVSELVGFKIRNPKFPNTVITLKMLLSHRSSINDSEACKNRRQHRQTTPYQPSTPLQSSRRCSQVCF